MHDGTLFNDVLVLKLLISSIIQKLVIASCWMEGCRCLQQRLGGFNAVFISGLDIVQIMSPNGSCLGGIIERRASLKMLFLTAPVSDNITFSSALKDIRHYCGRISFRETGRAGFEMFKIRTTHSVNLESWRCRRIQTRSLETDGISVSKRAEIKLSDESWLHL